MNKFEGFTYDRGPKNPELFPVSENAVQVALVELWAAKQENIGDGKNAAMLAWIKRGMAANFRDYADAHESDSVDISDAEALEALLEEIKGETIH